MHEIAVVPALLLLMVGLVALARRFALPYPIVLTLGGAALGLVPSLPPVRLDPEVVLLVFLPPILYSAAINTSFRRFRENLRPIALLAVGLVLTTTAAVAVVAHELVPGLPWPAAFALGAIVSPPDAVAATAIARRLGLPTRIVTILEGESLVNDATALVTYRMAVAALMTGAFSLGDAALRFVAVAAGGVLVGVAVGALAVMVRRRVDDPPAQITLSLLTPFAAYLPAEALHASGVLAVVTTGLLIGASRLHLSPATRLQALAVWEVFVFLLNGFVFILIGLQLPAILAGLREGSETRLLLWAVAVSVTVIVVRFLWVFPATYVPRLLWRRLRERDPYPGWRNVVLLSYTGMRGVVSLAAAFALPLTVPEGSPFPGRDLILFLTFAVILATLVLQGLALPRVIRLLRLSDPQAEERLEREARQRTTRAALERLDTVAAADGVDRELVERLRWRYRRRAERLQEATAAGARAAGDDASYEQLFQELLESEREALEAMHQEGAMSDDLMLRLRRELDLDESRVT